jgi:O-antigen ligase
MGFFALLAYLFFVFIRPQEFFDPLIGLPVVKLSLIIAMLFMLLQKKRRFDAPQNTFLFLLIPVILISNSLNGWFSGGVDSAMTFITTIFLPFLIIQNLIDTSKKQRVVMLFLIFCALVMVQHGLSQNGFGWGGVGLSQKTRITYLGIFNDPNDLGMFFVMVLPFIPYFFNRVSFFLKPIFLLFGAGVLQGVFLTNSRGALLGTISLVSLWFYLKYGLKKCLLISVMVLPLMLLVMSKFRSIDSEEASAEGRLDAWYEGFQMLFASPLLGVGIGEFTEHHHLTAHNSFVLVFAELGLLGYFLWIGFLTACVYMLLMLWLPRLKDLQGTVGESQESAIARTLTYSMLGYLVTCFFLSRSFTPLLYIYCAMIVATYYRAMLSETETLKLPYRYRDFSFFIWVAMLSTIVLIYIVVLLFL